MVSAPWYDTRRWPSGGSGAAASGVAVAAASRPPAASGPAAPAAQVALPTPEQRQRLLDAAKDDPQQLERRKRFLEALDRGDAAALERWQQQAAKRRDGDGAAP